MFLKSLTLRGFKSFADKTVLEFEPGVTVVVGPNGSGKSNLVDAVAWVLGAQGPRSLRGGKMDDVIFAGTPDRPALGRAEVSLCIDNAAGLLPIEFSEVTITRTLFRAGDSEYQINGAPCRLLDIQELLSDSGIGRQQHVIVGQGQLDAVLNARPEDRRAIVEEAAGILKFRKRRERAERRLEATEGNLLRLNDLLREVRRQLTPLQRQADAARRHGGLVEELRAIRIHLAGHEIAGLQARGERLRDRGAELAAQEEAVRARLRDLDVVVLDAETRWPPPVMATSPTPSPGWRRCAPGWRGSRPCSTRRRGACSGAHVVADEGVFETLVADAADVRRQLDELNALGDAHRGARRDRARRIRRRRGPARVHRDCGTRCRRRRPADGSPRAGDPARGTGAHRCGAHPGGHALRACRGAWGALAVEHDELEAGHGQLTASLPALRSATVTAVGGGGAIDAHRSADADAARADANLARWQARAEALATALDAARNSAALSALDALPGVVGPLVDHLEIDADAEAAVSALLGDALRAIVVDGPATARQALTRLVAGDAGALVVVAGHATPPAHPAPRVPGTRPLADCVQSSVPGLADAVARDARRCAPGRWRLVDRARSRAARAAPDRRHPWGRPLRRPRFVAARRDTRAASRAALEEARAQSVTASSARCGRRRVGRGA